jgi:hypothetical protein
MDVQPTGRLPEIPADHRPLAQELIYRTLVLPATRREFYRVRLHLEGPAPHPSEGPLIVYLTHTSWWDAYMLFLISYRVLESGFQNFIMMEARQLRAYRFFAWCGAFSVDRRAPGDSQRSIGYIAAKLRERRARALWIFPQGRLVPPERRPLQVFPGIARVVQQCGGAQLWPVALRYEFRGEQQPEALIRCGPAHYAGACSDERQLVDELAARLTNAADKLRDDVVHERLGDYQTLLEGREGINRWFDRLRRRVPSRPAAPAPAGPPGPPGHSHTQD